MASARVNTARTGEINQVDCPVDRDGDAGHEAVPRDGIANRVQHCGIVRNVDGLCEIEPERRGRWCRFQNRIVISQHLMSREGRLGQVLLGQDICQDASLRARYRIQTFLQLPLATTPGPRVLPVNAIPLALTSIAVENLALHLRFAFSVAASAGPGPFLVPGTFAGWIRPRALLAWVVPTAWRLVRVSRAGPAARATVRRRFARASTGAGTLVVTGAGRSRTRPAAVTRASITRLWRIPT